MRYRMVSRTGCEEMEIPVVKTGAGERHPLTDLEVVLFGSATHEDVESAVHVLHTGILV